jgi:hypothetical protein
MVAGGSGDFATDPPFGHKTPEEWGTRRGLRELGGGGEFGGGAGAARSRRVKTATGFWRFAGMEVDMHGGEALR